MRSLNGYLRRILSKFSPLIGLYFLLLLALPLPAQAAPPKVVTSINYSINEQGDLSGYIVYTFQSSQTQVVRYYTTTLPFLDSKSVSAKRDGELLEISTHQQDYGTDVVLDLNEMSLQEGSSKSFSLSFKVDGYTTQEPAYLSLPTKIAKTQTAFAKATIPLSFGELALKEADNVSVTDGPSSKEIKVSSPKESSLKLVFGNAVSYYFSIEKEVTNDDTSPISVELNLPPTTDTQIVTYSTINPSPRSSYVDSEGNLFAVYTVTPKSTLNIKIDGHITLGREYSALTTPDLPTLTTTNKYWSLTPEILEDFAGEITLGGENVAQLSKEQRDFFYNELYQHLITEYGFKESTESIAIRKGAKEAYGSSSLSAYDFADLTIALLREHSVASRLVIGYVTPIAGYFEDGFFHYWVEYWDNETGWIIMDPALSKETGAKYHGQELPGHVAIVRRGQDPVSPKLSAYLPGELSFELSKTQSVEDPSMYISIIDNKTSIFSPFINLEVLVENDGNVPIYSLQGNFVGELTDVLPNGQVVLPGQTASPSVKIETESTVADPVQLLALVGEDQITDTLSAQVSLDSPWWWNPLIATASLTIFSLTLSVVYSVIKAARSRVNFKRN